MSVYEQTLHYVTTIDANISISLADTQLTARNQIHTHLDWDNIYTHKNHYPGDKLCYPVSKGTVLKKKITCFNTWVTDEKRRRDTCGGQKWPSKTKR